MPRRRRTKGKRMAPTPMRARGSCGKLNSSMDQMGARKVVQALRLRACGAYRTEFRRRDRRCVRRKSIGKDRGFKPIHYATLAGKPADILAFCCASHLHRVSLVLAGPVPADGVKSATQNSKLHVLMPVSQANPAGAGWTALESTAPFQPHCTRIPLVHIPCNRARDALLYK